MSIASKLKSSNRKTVELLNQYDAETGELLRDENGDPLKLTIRRVTSQTVMLKAGAPMLLNMFTAAGEDETEEERRERMQREAMSDPEKLQESAAFFTRLVRVTVCAGVVDVPIVDKHESELAADEITPEMLGDDLPRVFNAIAQFSGIPFSAPEVAATRTFPAVEVAADSRPDGGAIRDDAERDATPNPG